ncbi:3-deoxy-7-phosphoheptulonate synthase [bacterium]|nr:3-deoxy-7-phosphoheptulonate synthase [bacterium]
MLDKRIENLNVYSEDALITPEELKAKFPLNEQAVQTVMTGQRTAKQILEGRDHRLLVVVGPCSIHEVGPAKEYAHRLKELASELQDSLFLVMRVYFEKPRTSVGWQGFIIDPYMDRSNKMEDGLHMARELLLELTMQGLPVAGEALDLISPQYVQDLISWTAIGARTTESQTHRKMASGFSSAVGFKNGTDGSLAVAVNAMLSTANRNSFISVDPTGRVAVVRTKGNPYTHVVLRGGGGKSNYDANSIADCESRLENAGLKKNIMVDCSHDNSQGDPANQLMIMQDVTSQILNGNDSIIGIMMESNLHGGKQAIPTDPTKLKPGISVTDACIDWPTTEQALRDLRDQLHDALPSRLRNQAEKISTSDKKG